MQVVDHNLEDVVLDNSNKVIRDVDQVKTRLDKGGRLVKVYLANQVDWLNRVC